MRLISYMHEGKEEAFGALDENGNIVELSARLGERNLGEALRRHGSDKLLKQACAGSADLTLSSIMHYRPVVADPTRIFCIGLNYEEHRIEANRARTDNPTVFLRVSDSQTGHGQPIICPAESQCLDFEGEIAIVIGREGRRVKPEHAWRHVLGISAYNDASVRDWQAHSTQWAPGKNFPSTGAFGPTLVTADEIRDDERLELRTLLNGTVVQQADTGMMIFPIPELIAYISTFTPLSPGDVIVTGTPGGVGFKRQPPLYMKEGDEVVVEVSRVGRLVNTISKESLAADDVGQ